MHPDKKVYHVANSQSVTSDNYYWPKNYSQRALPKNKSSKKLNFPFGAMCVTLLRSPDRVLLVAAPEQVAGPHVARPPVDGAAEDHDGNDEGHAEELTGKGSLHLHMEEEGDTVCDCTG